MRRSAHFCALVCTVLLTAAGCSVFKSAPSPPQPERIVLVPCPPKAPPVECPVLPELEGEPRLDEHGKPWIDAKPGALTRAWLGAKPVNTECWEALNVWRETHAACLKDIEDGE